MKKNFIIGAMAIIALMAGCSSKPVPRPEIGYDPDFGAGTVININTHQFVSRGYIGNGVQWDPYEAGPIGESDWTKLYQRMDRMHPALIRIMLGTAFDEPNSDLLKILDYCQSRGLYVLYGDWGGSFVRNGVVNAENISKSVGNVEKLIFDRGYDCIKEFIVVNEPNGSWSATNCSFELWSDVVKAFGSSVAKTRLAGKLKIAGPDAAVWTDQETWWITREKNELAQYTSLYNMHYYPGKEFVNSGEFSKMARAYAAEVPSSSKIVLGEVGFKQTAEDGGGWYQEEAARRVAADPFASAEDSQMFVFDYFYGTDMADITFQVINSGYSGCIAWMLDDAMHFKERGKLKIWGFWNILGEERYGAEKEQIRPWFYAWSLVCRYIPNGCDVYTVRTSGNPAVKAVSCVKDGKRTIALVNVSKDAAEKCEIKSDGFDDFNNVKKFVYNSGLEAKAERDKLNPEEIIPGTDLNKGLQIEIGPETLIVLSEM